MQFIKNKFLKGFTLSETLVTLIIIGVISAMLLPIAVKNYQKKATINKLKAIYSQLHKAIELSEVENGNIGYWEFSSYPNETFEEYVEKYITIIHKEDRSSIDFKEISGNKEVGLLIVRVPVRVYTTINGADLIIRTVEYTDEDKKGFGITVDTNGINRAPNQFGKDVFNLVISKEHRLYFSGTYDSSECTFENGINNNREVLLGKKSPKTGAGYRYQCNKYGRGMWCGILIYVDGWQIRKDYPW